MRGHRLRAVVAALALLTLAACTGESSPTPSSSSRSTGANADIVTGRNAIEKALRTNGGVQSVSSDVDFQYRRNYSVEIAVSSNQFFADVAKTAVAAASRVHTEFLPDITVSTGFGEDKQSLVLKSSFVAKKLRLPSASAIDTAVALFSDQPLVLYASGLSVQVRDSGLIVGVRPDLDTADASASLYRTMLAKWAVTEPAVRRLDVGTSFVVMADVASRRVQAVPPRVLTVWQAATARSAVVGSQLSLGGRSPDVQLTMSSDADAVTTARGWIDALVPLGEPFSISTSAIRSQPDFAFNSSACSGSGNDVTAQIYRYYVTAYPRQPGVAALRSCR